MEASGEVIAEPKWWGPLNIYWGKKWVPGDSTYFFTRITLVRRDGKDGRRRLNTNIFHMSTALPFIFFRISRYEKNKCLLHRG